MYSNVSSKEVNISGLHLGSKSISRAFPKSPMFAFKFESSRIFLAVMSR